jgi:hypothetical protein
MTIDDGTLEEQAAARANHSVVFGNELLAMIETFAAGRLSRRTRPTSIIIRTHGDWSDVGPA